MITNKEIVFNKEYTKSSNIEHDDYVYKHKLRKNYKLQLRFRSLGDNTFDIALITYRKQKYFLTSDNAMKYSYTKQRLNILRYEDIKLIKTVIKDFICKHKHLKLIAYSEDERLYSIYKYFLTKMLFKENRTGVFSTLKFGTLNAEAFLIFEK